MNTPLKTYDVSGPPSIALAIMALNLAGRRKWRRETNFDQGAKPLARERVIVPGNEMSAEYYAIIDRIARGEKP